MEHESPHPLSENERKLLLREVDDMKNLTGAVPPSSNRLKSTASFRGYPRNMTWRREETSLEETQEMIVDRSPMTNSESKDVLTRNNESMNHKCLGSRLSDGLRDQPLTKVATKLRKSSTSFRETLSQSNDGSDAPLAPRLDSLHQNGIVMISLLN